MKTIKTEDAVGTILCHDLTQIIPGKLKDARFRKGHIVEEEDIPVLLSMGKKNLFVYEINENMVHENDAAEFLCKMCISDNMTKSEIKEGKIELKSTVDGCFLVDKERLFIANSQDEIAIATIKDGNVVNGQKIAAMRVIPLVIEKSKLEAVKKLVGEKPLLKVEPYKIKTCGLVVTGSEVYNHLIEDKFSTVIEKKLKKFGVEVIKKIYCDDDREMIKSAINELRNLKCDMICCSGGMSVDPDDVTPSAIISAGVNVVSSGTAMLPGAMLLIGYFDDDVPILGLPGCVMYCKATVFDAVLPRVIAKVKWTKKELASLGYGGLCRQCKECHFPNCNFGN